MEAMPILSWSLFLATYPTLSLVHDLPTEIFFIPKEKDFNPFFPHPAPTHE